MSRRHWLEGAAVVVGCGGVSLVGLPAAAETKDKKDSKEKIKKDRASYQDQPKGKEAMCSTCKFFMPPASCLVVEGTISPQGWCQLFEKRSAKKS